MYFEIPEKHRDTPEAKRLLAFYAEFTAACAKEHEAAKSNLHERAPTTSEELSKRTSGLHRALKDAENAYDLATGEPKPVALSPDLLQAIESEFPARDRDEVIRTLSKTLGYLRRQDVGGERVLRYVILLAQGDKERPLDYADAAKTHWRDIIFWAENPEQSRLDTPEKIEDFQQTMEWFGDDRGPELDKELARLLAERKGVKKSKPWWRFGDGGLVFSQGGTSPHCVRPAAATGAAVRHARARKAGTPRSLANDRRRRRLRGRHGGRRASHAPTKHLRPTDAVWRGNGRRAALLRSLGESPTPSSPKGARHRAVDSSSS